MNVLVIGGTIFVGRHIVHALLDRGHEVTLFNRGQQSKELFLETEKLYGDRTKDLDILCGRNWDVVIDTCGYLPKDVQKSVEALKSACGLYVYISTGSVYKDKRKVGLNEDDEIEIPRNFDADKMTDDTYGELKAGCEQVVRKAFGERALIIRPGVVVGPYDPTDRFTYWVIRVAEGGKVLAPGNPNGTVQFIDARDLAIWTALMIERRATGIYNAVGPSSPLSMSEFLDKCKVVTSSNAELIWISDNEIDSLDINRWDELPLWIPENSEASGLLCRSNKRAVEAGLKFRPLAETIADTLKWWQESERTAKVGLSREREEQLLDRCNGIRG